VKVNSGIENQEASLVPFARREVVGGSQGRERRKEEEEVVLGR
jgi:hypothetical protein